MNKKQRQIINEFDSFLPTYLANSIYATKFLNCYFTAKRKCKFTQTFACDILDELETTFDTIAIKTPDYVTIKVMFVEAKDLFLNQYYA